MSALADLVLLAHAGFVAFAALGGLLVLRWARVAWLHVPAVLWGVWVELANRTCPLTPLENALREASGGSGYAGGCVEHYLVPLLYPDELGRGLQIALGLGLLLLNVGLYAALAQRASASASPE